MRIHYLQHVPFEDLANIETWINDKGHSLTGTRMYLKERLVSLSDFDCLIVLGAPFNIYEEDEYPWLVEEKKYIEKAIKEGKAVLGICLGAQLIADVLGGKVYQNAHKEIGWYDVSLTKKARESKIFSGLPVNFTAFHWHGDTFEIPPGAVRMAENGGCANQAFEYNNKVIGLQFHLESSMKSIENLIANCREEITGGKYIQSPAVMLNSVEYISETNELMNDIMDQIESEI